MCELFVWLLLLWWALWFVLCLVFLRAVVVLVVGTLPCYQVLVVALTYHLVAAAGVVAFAVAVQFFPLFVLFLLDSSCPMLGVDFCSLGI